MKQQTPSIDIHPDHWAIVRDILQKNVPQYEVWAFGSRATRKNKEFSDLDLAIITDTPLPLDVTTSLSHDFSESDLPMKLDVVDWAITSAEFRKVIERDKVVVQKTEVSKKKAGEWEILTLREAGVTLIDCDHRTPPAAATGYPYVAIPQMREGHLHLNEARKITAENFIEWTRKAKPKANDVVLSRRCNPGETAFVPAGAQFALGQNLVILRANGERVYPPFLRWLTRGSEWWSQINKFRNVGAVFDSLKCADVPKFELTVPPLAEQRTIANILGTLDDKIELNRKQNETLEAMARTLFKAWFVDFEPVRAKMEGRWRRGDSLPGLPTHLYDLFPERLVDSELGEIPEGWRIGSLGEVAVNPRRSVHPSQINDHTHYIALEHMPKRCIALTEWEIANGLESNKYEFKCGEILFGKLRPYFHKVGIAPVDGVCSTDIVVITPKLSIWFEFVLLHTSSDVFIEYANAGSTGTKMPRTSWPEMARYLLVLPSESVITVFNQSIKAAFEQIMIKVHESKSLAHLRDSLLPKLLSGFSSVI